MSNAESHDFPISDGARRRMRLREFQARLVERMQAARTGVDTHVNQLGVEIGESRFLVNLQQAGEIVPVGPITQVPLTRDWYLGVTNIRGSLISVIDLARFHGGPQTHPEKDSRILAFGPSLNFNAGLLISRVLGLRNMSAMEPLPRDPAGSTPQVSSAWAKECFVDEDHQVWMQLDLAQAIEDPRFLQVGI